MKVTVDIVIFTIQSDELKVLLVKRGIPPFKGQLALPGGFVCTKTKAWIRRPCVNSVKKLEFPMSISNNCIRSASQDAIRGSES